MKSQDADHACVEGEKLPGELILEGLRTQVALSKTENTLHVSRHVSKPVASNLY